MAKIPLRFTRITEAFDKGSRARPCESSGSEHSAELSDLVDSFIEGEGETQENERRTGSDSESDRYGSEKREKLESLLGVDNDDDMDDVKIMIRRETELASQVIGTTSSDEGFKRELMSRLRSIGLDAGLCKSRWKKIGHFPGGDYEYIDVNVSGTRYIIEVSLFTQFTVARPTDHYQSLLDVFPRIFVGTPDELKQVVRLMCTAATESMKSRDMHVPPWRKNKYMLAKWFGSYKRTTNSVTTSKYTSFSGADSGGKRAIGFESSVKNFGYCRDELVMKVNMRVGNLTQMFGDRNW